MYPLKFLAHASLQVFISLFLFDFEYNSNMQMRFKSLFQIFFSKGGTGSGKSSWIKSLIKYRDVMFNQKIDSILYCYGEYSPAFEGMEGVTFSHGFSEDMVAREKLGNNQQTLLILDE